MPPNQSEFADKFRFGEDFELGSAAPMKLRRTGPGSQAERTNWNCCAS